MDEFCIYACIQRINPKTESFHGKSDFDYVIKTSNNKYKNYIVTKT